MSSSVDETIAKARHYFRARAAESEALAKAAHFAPLRKSFATMAERYRNLSRAIDVPKSQGTRPPNALTQ